MVDSAKLVAKVETKGVTKATRDLDKFGREANEAEKEVVDLGKAAKKLGGFALKAGAVIGTAATAMGALAIKSAEAEKEWSTLATLANSSVKDFKAVAFATDQVGISAEKLGDISKDTLEKLGEFISTGGGGFADFFKDVAPLVNLTAQELQGLSGPEVLGRVKSAMDEANVSLEEQSFFLESIASDTTNLIPLLANESAELNRLAGNYARVNDQLAITSNQAQALKELSGTFDLLQQSGANAASVISATLAPTLNSFFNSVIEGVPAATQTLVDFFNTFIDTANLSSIKAVEDRLAGLNEEIAVLEGQDLGKRGGGRMKAGKRTRLKKIKGEAEEATAKLKELQEEARKLADAEQAGKISITGGSFQSKEGNLQKIEDLEKESLERRRRLQREFEDGELEAENVYLSSREDAIKGGLGNISTLMASSNSELFRIGQAAALANAGINIAEGITEALSFGPILGPALAGAVAVAGGVQIAAIVGQSPPSARQQGGQFGRGQDLLVGEKGPELVRFNSGGRISNTNETSAMMNGNNAPTVIINNNAPNTVATADTMDDGRVVVIVRETLNREIHNPNSQFNKGIDATRIAQRRR